jgi:hypothetical protein
MITGDGRMNPREEALKKAATRREQELQALNAENDRIVTIAKKRLEWKHYIANQLKWFAEDFDISIIAPDEWTLISRANPIHRGTIKLFESYSKAIR